MSSLPNLVVSGCLLGEKVRYNGTHKHEPLIVELFKEQFNIVSICPEVEMGLGVPRPPMHLEKSENNSLLKVTHSTEDLTEVALSTSKRILDSLVFHGAILKSKSPSCGYKSVTLMGSHSMASGLFAQYIEDHNIPIIDENDLLDSSKVKNFQMKALSFFQKESL